MSPRSVFKVILAAAAPAALALAPPPAAAQFHAKLKPATAKAFDEYVAAAEASMEKRVQGDAPFLWLEERPKLRERVSGGDIVVEKAQGVPKIKDGLIHDWIAGMFIPGATIEEVFLAFQDYGRYANVYPEVVRGKLIRRDGDVFEIYQRLRKKKVISVVLDTWHEARYRRLDGERAVVQSKSTKIQEVKDAGETEERLLPPGDDGGYLWRMYLYWRLRRTGDGVLAECRSVSLSRGIPRGLAWIVKPFVNSMPRESLRSSLQAARLSIVERRELPQAARRASRVRSTP